MSMENMVEEKVVDAAEVALWEIYGPHPGLALLKFWQGIVELCIAIVAFALSFAVLVAACVAISDVSIDTTGAMEDVVDMVEDSRSATGFLIFVSLFVLLWELGLVLVRFLNFGAVNRFFFIFALVVSIYNNTTNYTNTVVNMYHLFYGRDTLFPTYCLPIS
jgi:hypothetical protein